MSSMKAKMWLLMSVMHQDNFDIAYKTGIKSDLLIVNQCDRNDYTEINVEGYLWRMISTTERGLSKSRNMALKNARGDVCLFCDDDETMVTDYANIILNAFSKLDDATGVVFNLDRINYTQLLLHHLILIIKLLYSKQILKEKMALNLKLQK